MTPAQESPRTSVPLSTFPSPATVSDLRSESEIIVRDDIGTLPRIISLKGPLPSDRLVQTPDGLIMVQPIDLPTFQPVRRMRHGTVLAFRREECIEQGMVGLNRPNLKDMEPASRRMQEFIFRVEFQALESLFTSVFQGEMNFYDASGISFSTRSVYRFDSAKFQVLMAQLYFRRGLASEGFRVKGKPLPAFPVIGTDGDIEQWYSENDSQIVGVCFWVELEHFLVQLDKEYDFSRVLPRGFLIPPEQTPAQQQQQSQIGIDTAGATLSFGSHRDSPPHLLSGGELIMAPIGTAHVAASDHDTSAMSRTIQAPVQSDVRPNVHFLQFTFKKGWEEQIVSFKVAPT